MQQPLISIIIPVYNGSNYLAEAIESALAQTYDNKEIIVVNDGSNDGGATEKIALSYGEKIRYISKENGGVSSALNTGIENMKGDYFSWLSHDDKYLPDKLKTSVGLLSKYCFDDKIIAYTGTDFIDGESKPLKKKWPFSFRADEITESEIVLIEMLKYGSLSGCALLIPKNAFAECGLFDESLKFCQDILMWYRLFGKGYKLIADSEKNILSRLHANQVTQTRQDLYASDCMSISDELIDIFLSKKNSAELFCAYVCDSAKHNVYDVAKKCLKINKNDKILNFYHFLKIGVFFVYGKIRVNLKKMYYKMFFKISLK